MELRQRLAFAQGLRIVYGDAAEGKPSLFHHACTSRQYRRKSAERKRTTPSWRTRYPSADQQIEQLAHHFSSLPVVVQLLTQTEFDTCDCNPTDLTADQAEDDFTILLDTTVQHLARRSSPMIEVRPAIRDQPSQRDFHERRRRRTLPFADDSAKFLEDEIEVKRDRPFNRHQNCFYRVRVQYPLVELARPSDKRGPFSG